MAEFIEKNWTVISAYPAIFIIFGIIMFFVGFSAAKIILSGALSACKERLGGAKDEVARLMGEKDNLVHQLTEHGESIEDIKAKLKSLPKITISTEPPPFGKGHDGDVWIQHEK